MRFFNKVTDYFSLSKSQQGGIIIMMILIVLMLTANFLIPYFVDDPVVVDEAFLTEVEAFRASEVVKIQNQITDPFPFDPNSISINQMLELGLSDYQAEMIVKYRNAGGKFYKKEDFKRIYSITDADYEKLEPFINIASIEPKNQILQPKVELTPRPFNPNTADSVLFADIGLSWKQISQIINYRNAGGKFRIKSDFNKLYSISGEEYEKLQKYILLPSKLDSSEVTLVDSDEKKQKKERVQVEINSADTLELTKLYGIGPYYARKIVAYRNQLGGFYEPSQLMEVFGIDSTRFFNFSDQVIVNPDLISKIDLNRAGFKEILKHPYFEYYLVKSIFNYKDAVGDFKSVAELKQIDLVYEELFRKLQPYLMVESEDSVNGR